jgi:hypothetical protein
MVGDPELGDDVRYVGLHRGSLDPGVRTRKREAGPPSRTPPAVIDLATGALPSRSAASLPDTRYKRGISRGPDRQLGLRRQPTGDASLLGNSSLSGKEESRDL